MFKLLVWLGLLSTSSVVLSNECDFLDGLSPYQKEVAYKAYRAGYPYDLGNTMVAIAWKESKLGIYKVRYGDTKYDRSFGVMHTVSHWKTKGMSPFNKGRWIQSLITDDVLSIQTGLKDLLYWDAVNKGNWVKTVGSYNGGFNPNNDYSADVIRIVSKVKQCNFN